MRTFGTLILLTLGAACAAAQPAPTVPPDQTPTAAPQSAAIERAIAPYIQAARASYPAARTRFLTGLPAGQTFYVVTRLSDANGHSEDVFIRVQAIEGGTINGILSSQPQSLKGFKAGQSNTSSEVGLIDWIITKPDGPDEGNVVGKFLDTYKP